MLSPQTELDAAAATGGAEWEMPIFLDFLPQTNSLVHAPWLQAVHDAGAHILLIPKTHCPPQRSLTAP